MGCSKISWWVWCRRDSARAHKQVLQPVAVRRSTRQVSRTSKLGFFSDSREMEGEEESATTKTTGDYSPGETCCLCVVDAGFVWDMCLVSLGSEMARVLDPARCDLLQPINM